MGVYTFSKLVHNFIHRMIAEAVKYKIE